MMLILAMDTSHEVCSLGLASDDRVIASAQWSRSIPSSRHLVGFLEFVLRASGTTMDDIDAIAVASGPGLFTGIRVGMAFAKGLAWSLGKPIFGINTLEAIAQRVAGARYVSPVVDARKGHVFCALFEVDDGRMKRLEPDRSLAPGLWARVLGERCGSGVLMIGSGAELYREAWESIGAVVMPPSMCYDLWVEVARIGSRLYRQGLRPQASEIVANYVRASDAELSRKEGTYGDRGR